MPVPEEWLKFAPKPRLLSGDDKWNVFLSYRSVNRTWVLNLYDVLRQQGFKVFLDQCVLVGGSQLVDELEKGLSSSQAGVMVWSPASENSTWVRREYDTLERLSTDKPGFCFVPVRLQNAKLPVFASNRIFYDFSSYPDGPNGGELLRLLYAIVGEALSEEAVHFANQQDEVAKKAAADIDAAIMIKNSARLIDLFSKNGLPWKTSSALSCKAAEGLIELKKNDEAITMLQQIEEQFPGAIRPKQLHALALARRGMGDDLDKAQEILAGLYASGERDPETLGIFGRTWMDRYEISKDVLDLQESRDRYAEAFARAKDDYYTGINAASKSVLLGTPEDIARAATLAQDVQKIVGNEPTPGDYWKTATVGEVYLLMKNYTDAARLYKEAVATAKAKVGNHESTWKQACRLMAKLNPTPEERALVRAAFSHLPDCE